MDNFMEEVAVRRKPGLYNLAYIVGWVAMILGAILAVLGLQEAVSQIMGGQFAPFPIVLTLLFGGMAFLIWRGKDELKAEYEYTFTNGDLDVAKVLNNQKRKYLTSLNMKNVEAAGAVSSPSFQRFLTMKDVKKHNWFLNRDAKLYYYYFTKNAVKHIIIVELSDAMMELTRKANYMGFGVWQKD